VTAAANGARRGFGVQVALLAAARLSSVAAFFAVTVVGARLLPEEALGLAAIGQTVGMIAALVANGGINIAAIYFLQREPDERPRTVGRLMALCIGACAVAVLLVAAVTPLLVDRFPGAGWPLFATAAAMGTAMIAFEFAGALLLGIGQNGRYTFLELIRGWGSLLAVALLLLGPLRTDGGLVLGLALGYAAAAVMGLTWTGQAGMSIAPRFDATFSRAALAFGARGQVGNVFQFLGVRLDLLLVPALLDLRAAAVYYVVVRVSDVVGQAATAVSSFVFPSIAGQADRTATELTERATRLTLIAVAVTALVLAVGGELLLRVAFGETYATGAAALTILLIATVPLALGRVLAADLKGRGRPGLVSASALAAVVATIVFDLVLVPAFGIVGAAVASVLTYTASAAVLVWAFRRVTGAALGTLIPRPSDIGMLVATVRRRGRGAEAA
jgi:stage V sporulation protein B